MAAAGPDEDQLLTPGQVADMLRVGVETVARWADEGRIRCVRTPGGRRRYREAEIRALISGDPQDDAA